MVVSMTAPTGIWRLASVQLLWHSLGPRPKSGWECG